MRARPPEPCVNLPDRRLRRIRQRALLVRGPTLGAGVHQFFKRRQPVLASELPELRDGDHADRVRVSTKPEQLCGFFHRVLDPPDGLLRRRLLQPGNGFRPARAHQIGGRRPPGIRLGTGQIGMVLQQIDHGLEGLPGRPICLGTDGIELGKQARIALCNEERRRRAPDRRVLTRDIAECLVDRRGRLRWGSDRWSRRSHFISCQYRREIEPDRQERDQGERTHICRDVGQTYHRTTSLQFR